MADQGNRNVTGMEKIITKSGQAKVAHFVSGLGECEKKTVVWEVQNFAEVTAIPIENLRDNDNGITFDAGHSIGIPATWCFYLFRFGSEGNIDIAKYLELSPDSKAKIVKAGCFISLSCGDEVIASGDLVPQEFKSLLTPGGGGYAYLQTQPRVAESDILQKTENGRKALKFTLTLKVFSNKDPVEVPKARLLRKQAVISDLEKMLDSEDGADIEVKVPKEIGGYVDESSYTRKVHKGILMTRSSVFSKMFAKESEMVEAKTGKVVIKDLSPEGLDIFLHYIYAGEVLDEWVEVPEEILNAAEKYDLGILKQYCGENLTSAVTTKNALDLYQAAKLHKLPLAKSAIAEFISKNTEAVLDVGDDDN